MLDYTNNINVMSLFKEHDTQQKIDAMRGRFTERDIDYADYMHDCLRNIAVKQNFQK